MGRGKGVIGRGSWGVTYGGWVVESACVCAHFGVIIEVEVTLGFHALARDVMYQRLNRLFLIIRHRFLKRVDLLSYAYCRISVIYLS